MAKVFQGKAADPAEQIEQVIAICVMMGAGFAAI